MIGSAPTPSGRAPEAVIAELLLAQQERFAALDRGLPPVLPPPAGEILVAADGDDEGAAVVTWHRWPPASPPLLWSAAEVTELHPVIGHAGPGVLDALISSWHAVLSDRLLAETDSAATVTWPSRDVASTRVFLDRGLAPLAVLAVRPTRSGPAPSSLQAPLPAPPPHLSVRRAGPADLETCVALAMAEIAYSSHVGGSLLRPHAETTKRAALGERIERGEPVWLAEDGHRVVGMLECGQTDVVAGTWLAGLLPAGRWGYVNCASVLPGERGAGAGRALLTAALRTMDTAGTVGTYLYYNPPNPLSSVFWPRLGYRPLWTLWEVRPVAALR